jgi:hypothetical protein
MASAERRGAGKSDEVNAARGNAALCGSAPCDAMRLTNMTREEYEDRKRRLDEQLRAGFELLEAAHRQQVRALELVWMATSEGAVTIPTLPADLSFPHPVSQPAAVPAPAPPAPPPKRRRRYAWELQDEVREALAHVPEVFDRNDLCRALGYEADRGSLYRVLWELIKDGVLALEVRGGGRTPSRYKKTRPEAPTSDV